MDNRVVQDQNSQPHGVRRSSLLPGTRILVTLIAGSFLTGVFFEATGAADFSAWMSLAPARIWHGEVWRLLTHVLGVNNILSLLFGGFSAAWFGTEIERAWSRNELWLYVVICAAGSGTFRCLVTPTAAFVPGGLILLVLSLLVAWMRIAPNDTLVTPLIGAMTRRMIAIIFAIGLILVALAFGGDMSGVLQCAIIVVFSWLYLSVRWRWNASRRSRRTQSHRLHHLEL